MLSRIIYSVFLCYFLFGLLLVLTKYGSTLQSQSIGYSEWELLMFSDQQKASDLGVLYFYEEIIVHPNQDTGVPKR